MPTIFFYGPKLNKEKSCFCSLSQRIYTWKCWRCWRIVGR